MTQQPASKPSTDALVETMVEALSAADRAGTFLADRLREAERERDEARAFCLRQTEALTGQLEDALSDLNDALDESENAKLKAAQARVRELENALRYVIDYDGRERWAAHPYILALLGPGENQGAA